MRKWGDEERKKKSQPDPFNPWIHLLKNGLKTKMKQKKPPVKENLKVRYDRIIFDLFVNIRLK